MLRLQLGKRIVRNAFSVVVIRGFCSSGPCRKDWMANNDILLNATAAMKRNKEKVQRGSLDSAHTNGSFRQVNMNQRSNHNKKPLKKPRSIVIKWSTGSDRAKEAANSTVSSIFKMNFEGTVQRINSETNKVEETNIREFVKGINLDEVGLSIVDVSQINENTSIPLVKLVEARVALKRYSDEMAKQKEKELIEMGVIKKSTKSSEPDKVESTVKRLKISWEIKPDDLCKQKAHEIVTQLKKGFKVFVYIDSKNSSGSRNWLDCFENSIPQEIKLSKKEHEQRSFVVDKISEIVEEYSIQPNLDGTLGDKMIIKLAPKTLTGEKMDKKTLKEHKKKERQEKLQKRIEKKNQRGTGL
ncbi:hypothetical protein ZYGR_0N01240 [Zygosaccharomyces rouxii]|uniref:Altered inheritance of mitochondria protein 23, mitochondrial n=1 Tax=Zygosaccharomyces rouxii TaxID=4956 RepID=A0A1Q2ZZ62_ZYGRO|nr:hypothetical protein ZYGR_0N01240 [Zygosaccharomyces rouxii]